MVPEEEEEEKQVRREPPPPSSLATSSRSLFRRFRMVYGYKKEGTVLLFFELQEFVGLNKRSQSFLHCRSKTSQRILCVSTYGHRKVSCIDRKRPRFFSSIFPSSLLLRLCSACLGIARWDGYTEFLRRVLYDRHKRSMYHIAE